MSTPPLITVVTPNLNQGAYLERAIDSVLSQGYPSLEYIVIDGGSSDRSVSVLKKFEKHLSHWVSEPDSGQAHAINKSLRLARGEVLTWLNADDRHLPHTLRRFSELFASNPGAGVVVGAGRIVDREGRQRYFRAPAAHITLESMFQWMDGGDFMQPSAAFTREAWMRAGPLDESIHISLDVDLWLRMALAGVRFASTDEILSEALAHPAAKTTAFPDLMQVDCAMTIIRHGGAPYVRERLENIAVQLSWYRASYQTLAGHPLVKLLRGIKRGFRPRADDHWSAYLPPWRKTVR